MKLINKLKQDRKCLIFSIFFNMVKMHLLALRNKISMKKW